MKTNKLIKPIILFALISFMMPAFSSCKTTKSVAASTKTNNVTNKTAVAATHSKDDAVVELYNKANTDIPILTSKITVDAKVGGKEVSANGTLRIKKDEVIQVSLQVPLLGIEIGRLEVTPDYILVIDRFHKQYVKAPISELTTKAKTNLDFYSLQALFMNQIFLPGNKETSEKDMQSFNINDTTDSNRTTQLTYSDQKLGYTFLLQNNGLLSESLIATQNNSYKLKWDYSSFKKFVNRSFPHSMTINIIGGKTPVEADIDLSRISNDSDWDTHTTVSDSYKQISLEEVVKKISNL